MGVIIHMSNLPNSVNVDDIRAFFRGLSIPHRGITIVGGGNAFIEFGAVEDSRRAMAMNHRALRGSFVYLRPCTRLERQSAVENPLKIHVQSQQVHASRSTHHNWSQMQRPSAKRSRIGIIRISNLAASTNANDIRRAFFTDLAVSIRAVDIVRSGDAFVEFYTISDAQRAMEIYRQQPQMVLVRLQFSTIAERQKAIETNRKFNTESQRQTTIHEIIPQVSHLRARDNNLPQLRSIHERIRGGYKRCSKNSSRRDHASKVKANAPMVDVVEADTSSIYPQVGLKKRHKIPPSSVEILQTWLFNHRYNAYPTATEKENLSRAARITVAQVSGWMSSARNRILPEMIANDGNDPRFYTIAGHRQLLDEFKGAVLIEAKKKE